MPCTRVPAPRGRRPSFLALGFFVVLATAAAGGAQPPPPPLPTTPLPQPPPAPGGKVDELQNLLKGEAGPDLAARKDRLTRLINSMDLTQLSRVLLLQEWRTLEGNVPRTDAERKRMDDDSQARALAAERFRQKAKEAIQAVRQAPSAAGRDAEAVLLARAATADLIGETAAAGRKLDYLSQLSGGTTVGRPGQAPAHVGYLAQQLSDLTPDLIELTKSTDGAATPAGALARKAAARALGQIQPLNPGEVVGALEQLLADPRNSADLRLTAAQSMDSLAQAAADEMQRSLGLDDNTQSRFIDFAQAVWAAVLRHGLAADQSVAIRRTSLLAFGRIAGEMLDISVLPETNIAPPRETDPAIAKQIEERMSRYYQRLADVFAVYGKNPAPLAAAVRDPDPTVRTSALSILADLANVRQRLVNLNTGAVAPPAPPTGPPGGPASDGKTIKPRTSRAAPAAVILVRADEPVRDQSQQQALESMTTGLDQTIGALEQGLKAPDVPTRQAALDVLEILGPAAYPAMDALTEALHDCDKFVRWAAARTLGNLAVTEADKQRFTTARSEAAVRGTAELLRDQDVGVRLAAATALAKYGPRARSAAPILTATLNHSQTDAALRLYPTSETEPDLIKGDPSIRLAAFRALEAIDGDEAVQALPAAVIALGDGNVQVRQAAADMIGREGLKAPAEQRAQLVRELGKALADSDGDVRRAVSGALLRLMPQNEK